MDQAAGIAGTGAGAQGGPDGPEILWRPPADARETSRLGRFMSWLKNTRGLSFQSYDELWHWSVEDIDGFWSAVWEHFHVMAHHLPTAVLGRRSMPGARWFPGATLNYAEHALASRGGHVVLSSYSQTRGPVEITADELREQVARAAAGLARIGVGRGDRVAAYMPNIAEAAVAMLAAASLGAVWSSCSPEMGVRSVLDRFSQIRPKVLLAVTGYRYGAKEIDRSAEVAAVRESLPTLAATVVVPYLDSAPPAGSPTVTWDELVSEHAELCFEPVPFDHPLYVLYSSGTTGPPKAIVHGHGGILLAHLEALALQCDLGPGDAFWWFTTTGWMMWNFLMSGLVVGARIICFDGDPGHPDLGVLWRLASTSATTFFGASAPFIMACRKAGVRPGRLGDLSRLRTLGSTGAPLPAEGFRWVYRELPPGVQLASISGGTDVCSAFVGAAPIVPVWAGEISCRYLGAKVESFDPAGHCVIGRQGELVLTAPLPSMPVALWADPDGSAYRSAYFADFPGTWRHGDWVTITERSSLVITGRSDATLNRGGVRIGTSEIYSVVESLDAVADSLALHIEDPDGGPGELVLLVVMDGGAALDDEMKQHIAAELAAKLSPRHVPDVIEAVPVLPRTLSGKKLEVPAKRILSGVPTAQAASRGALADPRALDVLEELARARSANKAREQGDPRSPTASPPS